MLEKVVFGADPEFFMCYEKEGIKYALPPVILRREGASVEQNKNHPIFLRDTSGGFLHEDGAALEISVPPSEDWEVIFDQCRELMTNYEQKVLVNFPNLCLPVLQTLPTVAWEIPRWKDEGEDFQYATRFGCDADFDAWESATHAPEIAVMDASSHPYRYAGGHIHVSNTPLIAERPLDAIASLVYTLGIAAIAYSPLPDLDRQRVFRYGRPSKYRIQRYGKGKVGVEYRTPSCAWLGNKKFAKKVFTWAEIGITHLLEGGLLSEMQHLREITAQAITDVDQPLALELLDFIEEKL